MVRNEDEGGQAEVVWTCHKERPRIYRKMMEIELLGKTKKGRPKRRFFDVVKEDMREVGTRETDVENRMVWKNMIQGLFKKYPTFFPLANKV